MDLSDSVGASAVYSEGKLQVTNSTFTNGKTGISLVAKFGEGLVVKGDGHSTPVPSAFIGAVGGAIFSAFASANCAAIGSTFSDNACNGSSAVVAFGAGIMAFGGVVEMESTVLTRNIAHGGPRIYASWGGAVMLVYARLEASATSFLANSVRGPGMYALGGAIGAKRATIVVHTCVLFYRVILFEANSASGGSLSAESGAVSLAD
jgi:hypothetical protein